MLKDALLRRIFPEQFINLKAATFPADIFSSRMTASEDIIMARTASEVADLLEQVHETLMVMLHASPAYSVEHGVSFYSRFAIRFTLADLAEDLRTEGDWASVPPVMLSL